MCRIIISLLVVLGTSRLSFAQPSEVTVMIRVLDYKSGHPSRDRKVALSTAPEIRSDRDWVTAKTSKDGVASFTLKEPVLQHLLIDPQAGSLANWSRTLSSDAQFDNSGVLELATSQVLRQGIVGRFTKHPLCQPHTSSIPREHPGVIVIFTRHLNPWPTFRRFMHEAFNG